jgi:hypothetical protein
MYYVPCIFRIAVDITAVNSLAIAVWKTHNYLSEFSNVADIIASFGSK